MQLSEQEQVRRDKLKRLQDLGINPYPAAQFMVDATSKSIKQEFSEGKKVVIAGRLMSINIQGKASFAKLQDSEGRIQVYFNRDEICPGDDKSKYNDVFKKMRYVDLVVNPQVKDVFIKRTKIMNTIREFYNNMEFLEVETPILQPIPGGAAARPFITHHNTLDMPLYLRIANELYLKRLIVGGFDGVYEFSKDFRNEGMDRTHNPEFTVMEMYASYKDYNWMMDTTETLLEKIAMELHGTSQVQLDGKTIEFKAPYKRIGILDAIKEHTGFDLYKKSEDEVRTAAKSLGLEVDETMGIGKLIDEIFGEKCEHLYIQPTFIIDYPVEMSPLTKKHRSKEGLTERFELMVSIKIFFVL